MKKLFFVCIVSLFLTGEVQAQGPTPTPDRYELIRNAQAITYTQWQTDTITQTLTIPLDYGQMASYALTAYDFFANVSYIAYIIPFVLAMKLIHWLYRYVTGLRVDRRSQIEIDVNEVLGSLEQGRGD